MSLGLRGLMVVVPLAALLAAGAGGPEHSLRVLGPPVVYGLTVVVMVAFWWNDWPGARLRPSWAGGVDTALVVAAAAVLTVVGHLISGGPVFPDALPLAALVFAVMLQLSLVGAGAWSERLPPVAAGLVALALAWAGGLLIHFALVGRVAGADVGAAVACLGAWQVLCCVVWQDVLPARLVLAHALVLGGALVTFAVGRSVLDAPALSAAAGCFVAAGLLVGMLFEARSAGAALLLAAAMFGVLWAVGSPDWVAHATLNAVAASTLLHVAIGRRWPFAAEDRMP